MLFPRWILIPGVPREYVRAAVAIEIGDRASLADAWIQHLPLEPYLRTAGGYGQRDGSHYGYEQQGGHERPTEIRHHGSPLFTATCFSLCTARSYCRGHANVDSQPAWSMRSANFRLPAPRSV